MPGDNEVTPERRNGWQFDKTINMPTVISLVVLAVGGFSYISDINVRVAKIEKADDERKTFAIQQANALAVQLSEIKQDNRELRLQLNSVHAALLKKN